MEHTDQTHAHSVAFLRGATLGALVFSLFGTFWGIMTLAFASFHPVWSYIVMGLICAALVLACIRRLGQLRHLPLGTDVAGRRRGRKQGMWFGIIFGIECAIIAVTSMLLAHAGLALLIPIAVAVIVGIHFLPLAKVFEVPLYYVTGSLICLIAIASLAIANPPLRLATAGIGTALVLWASASCMLVIYRPGNSATGNGVRLRTYP